MKQISRIIFLSFIIFFSHSLSNSTKLLFKNRKIEDKDKDKDQDLPNNKYTNFLKGIVNQIVPPKTSTLINVLSCTANPWMSDTSLDFNNQSNNFIKIYQIIQNYNQYLVKEVENVCNLKGLAGEFFLQSWQRMDKTKMIKKAKIMGVTTKNPRGKDMFEKLGNFMKNNSYSNLKLSDQESYNIFNNISKGPLMKSVNSSKTAIKLREVIINSFNPMAVLSKLLKPLLEKLIKSGLFRGAMVSIECMMMTLKGKEKIDLKSIISNFNNKTKKLDTLSAVKFFSKLVCKYKKLKHVNKIFGNITKATDEKKKCFIIGQFCGALVRVIGKKKEVHADHK